MARTPRALLYCSQARWSSPAFQALPVTLPYSGNTASPQPEGLADEAKEKHPQHASSECALQKRASCTKACHGAEQYMFADVISIACTASQLSGTASSQTAYIPAPPCVSRDRMHRDTFMQPMLNSSGSVGHQAQQPQDRGLPHESSRRRSVVAPHPGRRSSRATRGSLTAFQIARSYRTPALAAEAVQ